MDVAGDFKLYLFQKEDTASQEPFIFCDRPDKGKNLAYARFNVGIE